MRLFIWADPYPVRYGTSMLLADAASEDEAREIAKASAVYRYAQYEEKRRNMTQMELGAPTRVVDLPCAEWHEWEE